MKVAVTGGGGFIGSHVVDKLVGAGHAVTVVDRQPRWVRGDAQHWEADILDVPRLTEAVAGCDAVFHLAGVADVDHAFRHPVDTVRTNVDGTGCVLEAARSVGARVLLASTVWVYGAAAEAPNDVLDEDVPIDLTRSAHVYTMSKLAAESLMHSYRQLYDVPVTVLRYGIPYGPRMRDELVIARFVHKALAGEPLTIAGDGRQTRSYVYVEDLAQAHVLALRPEAANEVFALDGPRPVSVREIAETVQGALGVDKPFEAMPARPGDYRDRLVSTAKAARVLGWTATTSFPEGVRRYIDWQRAQGPSAPVGTATT